MFENSSQQNKKKQGKHEEKKRKEKTHCKFVTNIYSKCLQKIFPVSFELSFYSTQEQYM